MADTARPLRQAKGTRSVGGARAGTRGHPGLRTGHTAHSPCCRFQPFPAGPDQQLTPSHCCRGTRDTRTYWPCLQDAQGEATESSSASRQRRRAVPSSLPTWPPPEPSLTPSQHSGILPSEKAICLYQAGQTKA